MIHLICWFTNKGNNITFVKYICNWQYTEHFNLREINLKYMEKIFEYHVHFFTYLLINFIVFSKYKVTPNECSDKWLVLFLMGLKPGHEIGQGFVHKYKTSQVLGMCECGFQYSFGHLHYAVKIQRYTFIMWII